jgi:hypothetical protein
LKKASENLEKGEELEAFYSWIKSGIWGGQGVLEDTEAWNEILGVKREDLDVVVGRIVKGAQA